MELYSAKQRSLIIHVHKFDFFFRKGSDINTFILKLTSLFPRVCALTTHTSNKLTLALLAY